MQVQRHAGVVDISGLCVAPCQWEMGHMLYMWHVAGKCGADAPAQRNPATHRSSPRTAPAEL